MAAPQQIARQQALVGLLLLCIIMMSVYSVSGQPCLPAAARWTAVPEMPLPSAERHVTLERLNWASATLLAHAAAIVRPRLCCPYCPDGLTTD